MPIAKIITQQTRKERASLWPIPYDAVTRVKQSVMNDRGNGQPHEGIDIFAPEGTEVVSFSNGTIKRVVDGRNSVKGSNSYRAGLFIDIESPTKKIYRYLHLGDSKVVEGQEVSEGDVIGHISGPLSSGLGKGKENTHLHFEIRQSDWSNGKYGEPIDPIVYLYVNNNYPRAVMMPKTENLYNSLNVGDSVYDASGTGYQVSEKPGYPYIVIASGGQEVTGNLYTDQGEIADSILASALKDTEYSFSKDGILKFSSWGDRIVPYRKQIESAKLLSADDKYKEAIRIRKEIADIRGESRAESFVKAQKVKAEIMTEVAAGKASSIAKGIFEQIPTSVKIGGAVIGSIAAISVINSAVKGKN